VEKVKADENPETGQIQAKGPSGEGRRPKWRRTKPPSGKG